MIGLDKTAHQSTLKMIFRGDNNPIMSSYFGSSEGNYISTVAIYLLLRKTAGLMPAVHS